MCWPFKGKHPLKIFVVENIDPLQVTIHSYANLCCENHSITLSNLIHFLQRPDLKQYLSQYKSFKNHHQPLSLLLHHDEESEASQPPSSLLHRLFRQPSRPGPLPSMMRPFFPCLSPRPQPSERRFLPARWGGSSPTSPSFGPLPPRLQRLPTSPPGRYRQYRARETRGR